MQPRWAERQARRLEDGFLPARSPLRRLARPTTTAFAGGRAILMELAHPAIAQAVADFDHFREDPARRALLTAKAFRDVIHGTEDEARAVQRRLAAVHARVSGPRYSATDPQLLLWVHATFIDSLLCIGQRIHGALSPEELSEFYGHAVSVGEVFGCPATTQPVDLAGFRAYVREMLDSLEVGDVGRDLARAVFWPPVPSNRAPIISLYRIAVFGTLPAGLRRQFGYAWGRPQRRLFVGGSHLARLGAPVTDQLFFAVADGKGRGVSAALALAGVRSSAR